MKKTFVIIIALIVGAAGFFGGMKYGQRQNGVSTQQSSALQTIGGRRFSGGAGENANGNFINGQIISMDDKSITVQLRDGGSRIVFFSPTTQIRKSVEGSVKDLLNNENITVTGKQNSDGSVTADSIQLRPLNQK